MPRSCSGDTSARRHKSIWVGLIRVGLIENAKPANYSNPTCFVDSLLALWHVNINRSVSRTHKIIKKKGIFGFMISEVCGHLVSSLWGPR